MAFAYFDTSHAIMVHDEIINQSGGALGILNIGLLDSVTEHVQNDFYYPESQSYESFEIRLKKVCECL